MDRSRPVALPGIRRHCPKCGSIVRRHRGFDEELTTLDPHQCGAKRSTWDVAPEPRRLGWIAERIARWFSW